MKTPTHSTHTLLLVALASLGTAQGFAATGILAKSGKFKPVTTFSDSYAERLVTIPGPPPEPGFPREPAVRDVEIGPEKIAAKIVANLAGFDFAAEIAEDMPVALQVGDFTFAATLGEEEGRGVDAIGDPKPFDPRKTKASFFYRVEVLDREGDPKVDRDGNPVLRKVGAVVFSWNVKSETLVVTLTNSDAALSGAAEIAASGFIGLADDGERGGKVSFVGEAVPVAVTFGSATGTRTAYGKGSSKTSYRKFGSEAADTLEVFPLNSVKVVGAADVTPPTLTADVPGSDTDGDGLIDIAGTVTDLPPGTISGPTSALVVEIFVNDAIDPVLAELGDPTPEGPDPKGKFLYFASGVALTQASNVVTIVATDGDGNRTQIQKTVTTTAPAP